MLDPNIMQQVMDSLGGLKLSHKDGDFWIFTSGEFEGKFEPFVRSATTKQYVGVDVSVSHKRLSQLATAITGEKSGTWQQIEWHQCMEEVAPGADMASVLRRVVGRELESIRNHSLETILKAFTAAGPAPARSMEQIMHLAALAYTANVHQLMEYLEGMKQGRRYGFAPMITHEMVQRAYNAAMAGLP